MRYCYLLLLLWPSLLVGQNGLQPLVDDWANDPYFQHASFGVSIVDVASGEALAGIHSDQSLIPASNLKLVSTASALAILGPDFRFTTRLAYSGFIDREGVLQGNLFIVGGGDPSLASPEMEGVMSLPDFLERLRLAIQQAGIRQISGRVIGDDRIFSSLASGTHWQWLDLGNYYGCGAFGLNMHDNLYYLRFQQRGRLGATPGVARIEPAVPGLQFRNEVVSAERGSGDNAYIFGSPYSYQRFLRGTIPVGRGLFTIKGAIPDPPLFAAQQLTQALEEVGILCGRPPASARHLADVPEVEKVLYTHQSPPLADIVRVTNMRSVNLYSEVLLRAIGWEATGLGSAERGLETLQAYWEGRGLDFGGVRLYDGSGMSPRNVLPTSFFTQLLTVMYQDGSLRESFYESLPVAARSGSLKNYFGGTAAAANLRAKSGYIEGVRSYSGYARAKDGRLLAFSMLLNNYDGGAGAARRKLFVLMEKICE